MQGRYVTAVALDRQMRRMFHAATAYDEGRYTAKQAVQRTLNDLRDWMFMNSHVPDMKRLFSGFTPASVHFGAFDCEPFLDEPFESDDENDAPENPPETSK